MRLRRTSGLGVMGFALVCGCMVPLSAWPDEPSKVIPSLPVVKTWGELRKQPAVEVAPGVYVRLGIQAAECGLAEGVFVYCLTDGYAPPARWSEYDRIGPLNIALKDGDGKPLDVWEHGFGVEAHREIPAGLDKCQLLFLRRVVVVSPGVVRIRVESRLLAAEPHVLAAGELKGGKTGHPWLRFEDTGPDREAGQTEFNVRNGSGGPALPSWPELCPLVSDGTVDGKNIKRSADELLPHLIPDAPSPGFELAFADGVLTVRSKAMIGTCGPDYHFLARWWVNGKPVTLAVPKDPGFGTLGKAFTADKPWPQVRLHLDLNLDQIGAKQGDEVGIQLLYCEHGTEPVTERKMKIIKGWHRDTLPLMSNRVTFRVK